MSVLLRPVAILAVTYLIYVAGFLFFVPSLVYPFSQIGAGPADLPRTVVKRLPPAGPDPALEVWVAEPLPGRPVIVYFMGFAGTLSVHEPRLRAFVDAGYGFAAMAYRGGGGQPGTPSERRLIRDAFRLYDGLDSLFDAPVDVEDRILYGFALGAGLAVPLAAQREEMALVLEAPFDRVCRTFELRMPLLPACRIMMFERFDIDRHIASVGTTLYLIHGSDDSTVPLSLGRALYVRAAEPKFVRIYPRGEHEDLPRFDADRHTIRFLDTLRGLP